MLFILPFGNPFRPIIPLLYCRCGFGIHINVQQTILNTTGRLGSEEGVPSMCWKYRGYHQSGTFHILHLQLQSCHCYASAGAPLPLRTIRQANGNGDVAERPGPRPCKTKAFEGMDMDKY